VSDLNTTAELNHDADDNRPRSVGRAGTPLTMGPTTTRFTGAPDGGNQDEKEDVVGTAQYTAVVE
jgi:hypothetical protein